VAQSGMMREYILDTILINLNIFRSFKEQLGETYGVMVYQEDVIKRLHYGLTAAYGDILRRAIKKRTFVSRITTVKNQFLFQQRQSEKLSEEVYRQIESFAGYSFVKRIRQVMPKVTKAYI
jgi:DNA polymerase III alpha subunit